MGKSLIAKDFAEHAKTPVLYFSLEMSKAELIKRQISGISRVDFENIRTSKIPDDEWCSIVRAADRLSELPIFYNDSGNLGIDELCAIAETGKLVDGIGLVVIDYLQLIKSEERAEAREREVANISRKLKGLARNLDTPVICLAQLNRSCENRIPQIPRLSDLRESGAIEQDADIVGFLYRPWIYNKEADKHEASFIIAKSRNTRTGKIKMVFDGNNQIFRSAAREEVYGNE
jgi:replicative DNA helicase